jgi:hypothetical protein
MQPELQDHIVGLERAVAEQVTAPVALGLLKGQHRVGGMVGDHPRLLGEGVAALRDRVGVPPRAGARLER